MLLLLAAAAGPAACKPSIRPTSRRIVLAAIPPLLAAPSIQPAAALQHPAAVPATQLLALARTEALPDTLLPGWEPLDSVDIGARTRQAVEKQYPLNFVSYLTRCLVNWEPVTRRWWEERQAEAAAFAAAEGVSTSTPFGSMELAREEQYRAASYRSLIASVLLGLEQFQGQRGCEQLLARLRSRYASAQSQPERLRALAQLYSMLDGDLQPVDAISALLGEADNGRVAAINLPKEIDGLGSAPIAINIERPPSKNGRPAAARALVRPTGRWRSVRLIDGGAGYVDKEVVKLDMPAPPGGGEPPKIVARVRNGSLTELRLVSAGQGYVPAEGTTLDGFAMAEANGGRYELQLSAPAKAATGQEECRTARAELLAEYALIGIEVTDGGLGYNVNEPPSISLRRVMTASSADEDEDGGWAAAAELESVNLDVRIEAQVATSLSPSDLAQLQGRLSSRSATASGVGGLRLDRGMTMELLPPALTPIRSSPREPFLLPLKLPTGVFGLPADAPVERQSPLTLGDAARIFLAGGLGSSAAHTALVPIDVVKTRLQSDRDRYAGPIDCARRLAQEEGATAFTQGLGATTLGYALAGSLSFGLVELFGRLVRGAAGPGNSLLFSVPLLGIATVMATAFVACALCPFEAVRVNSVRSGKSSLETFRAVLARGGPMALFEALPASVCKEVPYVVAKIITFDRASAALLAAFPDVADTSLSGTFSLAAGAVAGIVAVIASHPADVVFTQSSRDGGTLAGAISDVRNAPELLLQGLAPRILFGAVLVALQFYLYTQLRSILGVSKAELTLVWDALTVLKT